MDAQRIDRRRGFWPLALLWLPAGVMATAVYYLTEAEAEPGIWVMMLVMPVGSLLFLAPCGLPLALGCRRLWRLGHRGSAWTWGVGLAAATVAASLLSGPHGPLVVPLCAVTLSLPVWVEWWRLSRWNRW